MTITGLYNFDALFTAQRNFVQIFVDPDDNGLAFKYYVTNENRIKSDQTLRARPTVITTVFLP